MEYKVISYSHTNDIDKVEFDDYIASMMWFNRSMTSDVYRIELYENNNLRLIREK